MFSGQTNIKKLELLQYRALKFVYNDFETSYTDFFKKGNNMSISGYLKYYVQFFKAKFKHII